MTSAAGGAPPTTSRTPILVEKTPRVSGGTGICKASFVDEQGRQHVTWQQRQVRPYPLRILSSRTQQHVRPRPGQPQAAPQPLQQLTHVMSPLMRQHSGQAHLPQPHFSHFSQHLQHGGQSQPLRSPLHLQQVQPVQVQSHP